LSKEMSPERKKVFRAEAERLALLPRQDQRKILAMLRECAENPPCPNRSPGTAPAAAESPAESPMTRMSPLIIYRRLFLISSGKHLANQPKLKWPTWMFRRHGYVYLLPSQGIS
jgi:hypothetical protein